MKEDREVKYWAKAVNRVLPRERFVIGVTGGSGAGKTTLCEFLEREERRVIYPGREIRKSETPKSGMREMAPLQTESRIRTAIYLNVSNVSPESVIVDGFPRSVNQTEWALSMVSHFKYRFSVIIVEASMDVREKRIKERNDEWDKTLGQSRIDTEQKQLHPFLRWLRDTIPTTITVVNGIW